MTYDPDQPWFGGLSCDHLFADCPSRQRAMRKPGSDEARWCSAEGVGINPDAELVCGLCLHRLRRKKTR